jgi:hypothetical protein
MFTRAAVREGPPEEEALSRVPVIVLPGEDCDHGECPSTVQVSITLPGGRVLGFCGHHGREAHAQMTARGIVVRVPELIGDLKT